MHTRVALFPHILSPKFAPYDMQSLAASPEERKSHWSTWFEMSSKKVSLNTESIPERWCSLKFLHLDLALEVDKRNIPVLVLYILSEGIHSLRGGGSTFLFESYNRIGWDLANSLLRKIWQDTFGEDKYTQKGREGNSIFFYRIFGRYCRNKKKKVVEEMRFYSKLN